ncbi:transglutaminase domain-containing protein, partial [Thiolapillus sp.]|uniref:transglutaminase domain-containing protein n=1 Tax=Thiolapillus sp. TaxID=2017437 RepID=UPI003AF6434F
QSNAHAWAEVWLANRGWTRVDPTSAVAPERIEHSITPTRYQACLRPRDRFWDIPVPKIDSAFDNLLVPQPSWSPSTTQQLRKLVAAPYLPPNDWTPRLDAYFASPLALCARRVSSAASRLLGSTSLRFALHGWQRLKALP